MGIFGGEDNCLKMREDKTKLSLKTREIPKIENEADSNKIVS